MWQTKENYEKKTVKRTSVVKSIRYNFIWDSEIIIYYWRHRRPQFIEFRVKISHLIIEVDNKIPVECNMIQLFSFLSSLHKFEKSHQNYKAFHIIYISYIMKSLFQLRAIEICFPFLLWIIYRLVKKFSYVYELLDEKVPLLRLHQLN